MMAQCWQTLELPHRAVTRLTDLNLVRGGGVGDRSLSHEAFCLQKMKDGWMPKACMKVVDLKRLYDLPATFSCALPQSRVAPPCELLSHQSCRIPAAVVHSSVSITCNYSLIWTGCVLGLVWSLTFWLSLFCRVVRVVLLLSLSSRSLFLSLRLLRRFFFFLTGLCCERAESSVPTAPVFQNEPCNKLITDSF